MPVFLLNGADQTTQLAHALAPHMVAGQTLALNGPLGSGKSHFARGLIAKRLSAMGQTEDIPSPSYTLVQTYDLGDVSLWHADLYRLVNAAEIIELGLSDAFDDAICVVEWASKLGGLRPSNRLDLRFEIVSDRPDARQVSLSCHGADWGWLPAATDHFQRVQDD